MEGSNGAFFLDTSTQITKTWEDHEIKEYIKKDLSEKPCYCSEYVRNEYKSNIVNESVLVYNVIVNSNSLDQARSRLDNLMKDLGRKKDELPYKILRRLFTQYNSPKPVLRFLEKLIEGTWENYFYGDIKRKLFNLVECKSAQEEPRKTGNGYTNITNKCPRDCNVDNFLSTRHSDLKRLKGIDVIQLNSTTDPKGTLLETQKTAGEILNGSSPKGKNCKKISDSIISIEARDSHPDITLHSMDSDFELLGNVLNIPTQVRKKRAILKELRQS